MNPPIRIGQTKATGQGIFATKDFAKGEYILEFEGELCSLEEIKEKKGKYADHSLQIGKNLYLGPGGVLDYVNHSCDPNGWVKIVGTKAFLYAKKDIKKGEELTFDYSTTMAEGEWELFPCKCGSKSCRSHIQDFKYVPKDIQEDYLKKGMIAAYVKESLA